MWASSASAIQPFTFRQRGDERCEGRVEQHAALVGVIDDEGDLFGK
jgi:hypothetical protein